VIEVLLTLDKKTDINAKNYEMLTPLHLLCRHSSPRVSPAILEVMIKFGANFHQQDGIIAATPLHYCAATGIFDIHFISTCNIMDRCE
jgi:ankyrin repeat protein